MKLCCYSKFWWGVAVVVTAVLVVLGAAIGILYTSFTYEESLHLTYGDTRLISSYSSVFCEGLKLENSGMPNNLETNLSVYPDLETSKLSSRNAFSTKIVDLSLSSKRYHYWRVFIHPDSTVVLEACILSGTGMQFLIIRSGGFSEWRDGLDIHTHSVGLPVTHRCNQGPMTNTTLDHSDYDVEDVYYILLIGIESIDPNVLNGTLHFEIPEYDAEVGLIDVPSCTTGGRRVHPCSVDVPLYVGSYAVISAEATSLGLHSSIAAVNVRVSCKPRAGVYALMAVVPVAVMAVVCFVSACVYWYVRYNRLHPPAGGAGDPAAAVVVANPSFRP